MNTAERLKALKTELDNSKATLIAVSKTKSEAEIMEAYEAGHRDFGENQVQELVRKQENLPKDIRWHQIGTLQTNKVKYLASFISLIHSVDSLKLLQEINKQAKKHDRIIDCLLQIHIADEDTKFGLDHEDLIELLRGDAIKDLQHVRVVGLMGIASNTSNERIVKEEFYELKTLFDGIKLSFFRHDPAFSILSMGMSSDYKIALEQGSNMIRVGSAIFGARNYNKQSEN